MANTLSAVLRDLKDAGKTFYVYILHRADGSPFYVGKGTGLRIAAHGRCSEKESTTHKARLIRKLVREGEAIGYTIAATFDNERDAFAAERALISAIGRADRGRGPLANHTDGGEGSTNPSEETIAKRVVKLRAVMADPAYRAAAIRSLRSVEQIRAERARAATKTASYREATSKRCKAAWADPEFRAKTVAASEAARNDEWRAKHAAGIARTQADPEYHARRNAGLRAALSRKPKKIVPPKPPRNWEETRRKMSAAAKRRCADPAWREQLSAIGKRGASVRWEKA